MFFYLLLIYSPLTFSADFQYTEIKEGDVIQSGSELNYPPFSVVDSGGKADGFSVELLRAALKAEGLGVDFKVGEWTEVKNDLEVGNIRVLPLVGRTPEREAIFDFTVPYFSIVGAIYTRAGDTSIKTLEDLKGKELVGLDGDNAVEYIKRKNITDRIVVTKTFDQAFSELSAGQHDAIITSIIVGDEILSKLNIKNIVRLEVSLPEFTQNFCFAVRENDKDLLEKLNDGLSAVIADGTYDMLYTKWFPKPILPAQYSLEQILIFGSIIIFLILIVSVFILRKEVRKRTEKLMAEMEKSNELKKEVQTKNKELEETLNDFYTVRLGMQEDLELGKVYEENKKIKERLDKLKEEQ